MSIILENLPALAGSEQYYLRDLGNKAGAKGKAALLKARSAR